MKNYLSDYTQEILPDAQIQMPPNQNDSSSEKKNTKYFKKTVKGLGVTTIVLSVVVFLMSIVEVTIQSCRTERVYDYSKYNYYDNYNFTPIYNYDRDNNYLRDYKSTTRCYSYGNWGVGIWCSLLPFLAGIFGVIAGSKSLSQKKNGLLMGFNIAGAFMSFVSVVTQSILTFSFRYFTHETPSKLGLQIAIISTTFINMVLLITSSVYSCCLCKSCCGQSRRPVEQRVIYVPHYPNQQILTDLTSGTNIYSQGSQTVFPNQQQNAMRNVQQNQQVLASAPPMAYTNRPNILPPQYNQLNLEKPMYNV